MVCSRVPSEAVQWVAGLRGRAFTDCNWILSDWVALAVKTAEFHGQGSELRPCRPSRPLKRMGQFKRL